MVKIVILFAAALAVANANFKPGKAPVHQLNDGTHIPCFGLGTYVEKDPKDITRAVETAIDEGYRHIDTATLYKTEKQVGQGVNNKIKDGTIKREDIYITTKLWNNKHRYDQVVPDLRESLKNLNLDYVDLYLIHTPGSEDDDGKPTDVDFLETWKGMEEAQRLGLTKSIGVSNFNETQIQRILDNSKVAPAVNQIEVNPNLTQQKLVQFCQERGIVVVAYSPLGAMPSSRQTKTKPAPHLDDPILTAIGNKYHKSTVQVVLRYLIDRDLIPIPKSVTPSRIRQNIAIFDFNLTPDEIAQIDKFNINTSIYEL